MRTREQIDAELEKLGDELSKVEGTRTEVYTRIVGYYRSVTNWNNGKREEYRHRKLFNTEHIAAGTTGGNAAACPDAEPKIATSERKNPDFYIFFYRTTCPNCPPVKNYINGFPVKGRHVNVDEPEGLALAEEHQVLASPTVVFFDADNNEIYRAHNVQSLKEIARFAGIKRELASV